MLYTCPPSPYFLPPAPSSCTPSGTGLLSVPRVCQIYPSLRVFALGISCTNTSYCPPLFLSQCSRGPEVPAAFSIWHGCSPFLHLGNLHITTWFSYLCRAYHFPELCYSQSCLLAYHRNFVYCQMPRA